MAYTYKDLINDFDSFRTYVESLREMEDEKFFAPILPGKWSTAEIISHISFWDQYIRTEILPKMKLGAVIESIDFDTLNHKAAAYALSGITKNHILDEAITERSKLINQLKEIDGDAFFDEFMLNGEEIDPYSGYPHTIFNYIAGFTWHDNHHKKQIEAFNSNEPKG